ncbi:MAG: hypothetical protein IPK85_02645 [Gemmatimonadetes bacterium]|nr:hypothetical protein [Gemmatimonadota bacterium]
MYSLLAADGQLQALGLPYGNIWPAQALDTAPRNGRFLILRWEETTVARGRASQSEVLTIWAHCPREMSTDFAPLDAILNRVTEILTSATHVTGADGVLTCVDYNGKSPDLNDEGYKTITKNAAYTVVSR